MRADRLLSIMLLLQVHRRMTARELAQRLEVSERTIHRDMEALSCAGIPVVAERGTGGGWSLIEEYRTNLTGLNEHEIQTLFLARPSHVLSDLGLHKASEAALLKLLAALPAVRRQDAEYVSQRIHIDTSGWHNREEAIPALPTLQQAIWQERKICFTYLRGETLVERVVDPLGLVAKGSTWYLVAAVEGQLRSYRVSRIQSARMLEDSYVRPLDFDLAAYWAQSSRDFTSSLRWYLATIQAAPDAVARIYGSSRLFRIEQIDVNASTGWITFQLGFDTPYEACAYIMSFGDQVEVLEPAELRAEITQLAACVLEHYSGKNSV
ncbi:helix-turn-helix transcriptional regulator [Dictyobacter kobayashii]|uniref:Transcriptional regulator n=1 Tax=Dictyobacter kobayashii TaxID=2014872 RepID=A0A402AWN2_9CHLR|nr:YafY family protein [Dictyobacter kobayashii]GCE23498.1 transcriptional regulator [Dictyobacter kobayashii]